MDKIETQKKIVKAATQCFLRFGYEKTTLSDIGNLVGLKKNSLYYYYENKEAIFKAVINNELIDVEKKLKNKFYKALGMKKKILEYLKARIKDHEEKSTLYTLLVDSVFLNKLYPSFFEIIYEMDVKNINEILIDGMTNKEIKSIDTIQFSKSMVNVVYALIKQNMKEKQESYTECSIKDINMEEIYFVISTMLDGISIININ